MLSSKVLINKTDRNNEINASVVVSCLCGSTFNPYDLDLMSSFMTIFRHWTARYRSLVVLSNARDSHHPNGKGHIGGITYMT